MIRYFLYLYFFLVFTSLSAEENLKFYVKKAIENMHPLPKIGSGDDFSDIGSFLLSDKNSWITGQIFHIDGGRSSLRIKS